MKGGRETSSPPSDRIVNARLNHDRVARCEQHVLLQVPPTGQTFPLEMHLQENLAFGWWIDIFALVYVPIIQGLF